MDCCASFIYDHPVETIISTQNTLKTRQGKLPEHGEQAFVDSALCFLLWVATVRGVGERKLPALVPRDCPALYAQESIF